MQRHWERDHPGRPGWASPRAARMAALPATALVLLVVWLAVSAVMLGQAPSGIAAERGDTSLSMRSSETRPVRAAYRAIWVREGSPSLARMPLTWHLTVDSEMV